MELGKADWIYDDEYDMHIPCCTTRLVEITVSGQDVVRKCGAGPLTGDEITDGHCREHRNRG